MSDLTVDPAFVELAGEVLGTADPDATGFDDALWGRLTETGLARLALPEEIGGSGAGVAELAALLVEAGAAAAAVPLLETDLAARLAAGAGLTVPDGPLAFHAGPAPIADDTVTATLPRVGWARCAAAVVVLGEGRVAVLRREDLTVAEGSNVAEEPRDTVTAEAAPAQVAAAPAGAGAELALRAALGRALLIAGAAREALARSVGYAGERVQFGRPIGRFQAVQQQLALAAAEVAAASAAGEAAARIAAVEGFGSAATEVAVAAAKVRAGQTATAVARIAHQVHGAIGFTREHELRLTTTRLWAWRDEDGSDGLWADRLGALVADAGPDGLWPLVTG